MSFPRRGAQAKKGGLFQQACPATQIDRKAKIRSAQDAACCRFYSCALFNDAIVSDNRRAQRSLACQYRCASFRALFPQSIARCSHCRVRLRRIGCTGSNRRSRRRLPGVDAPAGGFGVQLSLSALACVARETDGVSCTAAREYRPVDGLRYSARAVDKRSGMRTSFSLSELARREARTSGSNGGLCRSTLCYFWRCVYAG